MTIVDSAGTNEEQSLQAFGIFQPSSGKWIWISDTYMNLISRVQLLCIFPYKSDIFIDPRASVICSISVMCGVWCGPPRCVTSLNSTQCQHPAASVSGYFQLGILGREHECREMLLGKQWLVVSDSALDTAHKWMFRLWINTHGRLGRYFMAKAGNIWLACG